MSSSLLHRGTRTPAHSSDSIDSKDTHRLQSHSPPASLLQRASPKHSSFANKMSNLLPRVSPSGYKRVDAPNGQSRRFRFGWKKFAVGAAVVIVLVWLFGPRERREQVLDKITSPSWPKVELPGAGSNTLPSDEVDNDVPYPPKVLPTPPNSLADDPDRSRTVVCSKPYNEDARLVQYALMIDAGSTGSRIHIYKFNNCGPSPAYEYEVFKQTKPGLSDYGEDPLGAAQSLDVLLDEAVNVIPQALWSCTPVAVKATAGLRLLGATESAAILDAVKHRLHEKYPFAVVERDGVVIMDGSDEGVYAWITTNYLLGTIRPDSPVSIAATTPGGPSTYAVLDLGGASTQIVFEPSFGEGKPDAAFVQGEHKYELNFGGKSYILYQHSYLGYGLMRARKSIHRLVEFMASFNQSPSDEPTRPTGDIPNPCLAKGTSRIVQLDAALPGEEVRNVTMVGRDVGGFESCNRIVELVMAKDAICQVKPCSFNGVYQPSILETFPTGQVLLLSYFYDRISPFFSIDARPPLSVSTIASLAKDVCGGVSVWSSRWGHDEALLAELEDRPEWCLDLTFMHALLRLGYEFDETRAVQIEKQLAGTELGWCLGATIALVGGDLTCRV